MRKIELILKDEKTEETVFTTQLFGMDFSDKFFFDELKETFGIEAYHHCFPETKVVLYIFLYYDAFMVCLAGQASPNTRTQNIKRWLLCSSTFFSFVILFCTIYYHLLFFHGSASYVFLH